MKFNKNVYPELMDKDFLEKIQPLESGLDEIVNYTFDDYPYDSNLFFGNDEIFPYYNISKTVMLSQWIKNWESDLENNFVDFKLFENTVQEELTKTVFFYLVRSLADQIKQHYKTTNQDDPRATSNYYEYCRRLNEEEMLSFIEKYPFAWSRANLVLNNKIKSLKNTIKEIQQNRQKIQEIFEISKHEKLVSLDSSGDTHNSGNSVVIITFEHGKKLVFKPRPTSGERNYYNFIQKFNKKFDENFVAIKTLTLKDCGFCEFLISKENQNQFNNKRMYNAGKLGALLYVLNASDMHFNNVSWSKDKPIPLDLETLFQPRRMRTGLMESNKSAYLKLETSIFGTGILPFSLGGKKSGTSVDIGFVGSRDESSESPFKDLEIKNGFSSDIEIVWKKSITKSENKVQNPESEESVMNNAISFGDGFSEVYEKVLYNKDWIRNVISETFKDTDIRYLHNMTYRYEQVLRTLSDSAPSQNSDISKMILSRLGILSLNSSKNIVLDESRQIWNGDIPYFLVTFQDINIKNHIGGVVDKLPVTPEVSLMRKIDELSKKDLNTQLKIIKLAFVSKISDPHDVLPDDYDNFKKNETKASDESVIKSIVTELVEDLLSDRYDHLPPTWIGPVAKNGGEDWAPGVLGYDLYAGRVGPALALALTGKTIGDDNATKIASDIFEKSAQILLDKKYEIRSVMESGVGGFSGISGLAWALYASGNILDRTDFKRASQNIWNIIDDELVKVDENFFDIISGKSGALVMRYATDKNYNLSQSVIDDIINLANKIIDDVVKNGKNSKKTSGFAHGIGQIIWFLSILYQKNQDNIVAETIHRADKLIWDSYLNDDQLLGIYEKESGDSVSPTWCNGLSGLLVAYSEGVKAGIFNHTKLNNIITQLESISMSDVPIYCHGSLGNYEAISYASQFLPKNSTVKLLDKLQPSVSADYIEKYFSNGSGRYTLSSGLMSGKSGALLFLCKHILNAETPSVITLNIR